MDKNSGGDGLAVAAVVTTGLVVLLFKPAILLLGAAYIWQRCEGSDDE